MDYPYLSLPVVLISLAICMTAVGAEPTTQPVADPEYRIGDVDI